MYIYFVRASDRKRTKTKIGTEQYEPLTGRVVYMMYTVLYVKPASDCYLSNLVYNKELSEWGRVSPGTINNIVDLKRDRDL